MTLSPVVFSLRQAQPSDIGFLRQMLYEALYVHEDEASFPEAIIDEPELRRYVDDFGSRPSDLGLIGLDGGVPVGACWVRAFSLEAPGYGWVDDETPELTVAVMAMARRQGLGTTLIESVVELASVQGVERISLSVDARSPALRLYERLGFQHVDRSGTSITMARSIADA
ncbi:MAG TPA: GNAT family N-acetyltransferase [Microthrixaceae bacterium]|nr:GNAT family N-acetyltransferase [Microthrixaceae bacterium]